MAISISYAPVKAMGLAGYYAARQREAIYQRQRQDWKKAQKRSRFNRNIGLGLAAASLAVPVLAPLVAGAGVAKAATASGSAPEPLNAGQIGELARTGTTVSGAASYAGRGPSTPAQTFAQRNPALAAGGSVPFNQLSSAQQREVLLNPEPLPKPGLSDVITLAAQAYNASLPPNDRSPEAMALLAISNNSTIKREQEAMRKRDITEKVQLSEYNQGNRQSNKLAYAQQTYAWRREDRVAQERDQSRKNYELTQQWQTEADRQIVKIKERDTLSGKDQGKLIQQVQATLENKRTALYEDKLTGRTFGKGFASTATISSRKNKLVGNLLRSVEKVSILSAQEYHVDAKGKVVAGPDPAALAMWQTKKEQDSLALYQNDPEEARLFLNEGTIKTLEQRDQVATNAANAMADAPAASKRFEAVAAQFPPPKRVSATRQAVTEWTDYFRNPQTQTPDGSIAVPYNGTMMTFGSYDEFKNSPIGIAIISQRITEILQGN